MGKKRKIKLTEEQKEWLSNIQWYIQNKICWTGEANLDYFKELVQDGKYAVFSMGGEPMWDHFDSVICTNTVESARTIERWNPSALCRTVHLGTLWTQREVRKMHAPHFTTLVEKWDHD